MRRLAPWAEIAGVVLLGFGYPIFGSLYLVVHPGTEPPITEAGLRSLLLFEPLVLAPVLLFLWWRGWSFRRIGLQPGAVETLIGIGLYLVTFMVVQLCWLVATGLLPELGPMAETGGLVAGHFRLATVLAISLVNPLYEELLVSGYVMTAVQERGGTSLAINLSLAIRLLYHLYQGPQAAISIIPIGLSFAFYYAWSGRLWPLVVAHAGLDFFALEGYVGL